jgi:hypothetical protein
MGGIPEKVSGMVRVMEATKGSGYVVIRTGIITDAVHLIREEPGTSERLGKHRSSTVLSI